MTQHIFFCIMEVLSQQNKKQIKVQLAFLWISEKKNYFPPKNLSDLESLQSKKKKIKNKLVFFFLFFFIFKCKYHKKMSLKKLKNKIFQIYKNKKKISLSIQPFFFFFSNIKKKKKKKKKNIHKKYCYLLTLFITLL